MKKGKIAFLKEKFPHKKLTPKKSFALLLGLLLFNYFFHFVFQKNDNQQSKRMLASTPNNWTAHRHTKEGTTTELPTVEKLKKLELYKNPSAEKEQTKFAKYEGRNILGADLILQTELPKKLHFLNEKRDDWAELAANQGLRFHDQDTELFIDHKKELILLAPSGARYVEQAVLTYVGPNKKSSFSALIDSSTGEIIKTWGSDIRENYKKKKESHYLSDER